MAALVLDPLRGVLFLQSTLPFPLATASSRRRQHGLSSQGPDLFACSHREPRVTGRKETWEECYTSSG